MEAETIQSPCIGVCTMGTNGTCMGCMRTLEEIADWHRLSEEQKRRIVESLAQRMESMFA